MNLKKIAGLCKHSRKFHIINLVNSDKAVTAQWVMIGPAAYMIGNIGVTSQMLARFAGLESNDLSSFRLVDEEKEPPDWMQDFPKIEDIRAEWATVGLIQENKAIRLFRPYGGGSILPINSAYLSPIEDSCDYYIRYVNKSPTLAVKSGLFVVALIQPYDVFGEQDGIRMPGVKAALEQARGIWT